VIAVADTSPICYLVLIGEVELLEKLFTRFFVPEAVVAELWTKTLLNPFGVGRGVSRPGFR
jgi:predicted nucleic acid-binding protein